MPRADCDASYVSCTGPLVDMCRGALWSPDCDPPSQDEADACIDALLNPATLSIPDDEVPQCARISCG